MQLRVKSFFTTVCAVLVVLSATPSDCAGGIIVSNRLSGATASASVCDNPVVASTATDSLPFAANHSNSFGCDTGIASGSIQYADSLSFTPFGSLAGVFAGGSASCSATHQDDQNRFDSTRGSGVGTMSLNFEVVDQPAQFVFDGTVELQTAGPGTAGEVEFSIVGVGIEYRSRVFISGDSTTGPIVWHETGDLQPGFYAVVVRVRAAASPDFRLTGVSNTASVSMSGTLRLTQEFAGTVVNSTGDAADTNPGDGVCDAGGTLVNGQPQCTLRAAIMEANATPGLDRITFEIPLSDPQYESATDAFRIKPQPPAALPEIVQPLLLDATTQLGSTSAAARTVAATASLAGPRPKVILDGIDLGTASDEFHGLDISAGNSEVRGLAIVKFNGHGIYLRGKGRNKVQGNFIGVAPGATSIVPAGNNRDGVRIEGIAGNLIGGLPESDRNVISNNGLVGTAAVNVHILNPTATNNDIIGNYIGTDDTGLLGLNNTTGVLIDRAPGNAVASNVISGNQVGIRILGREAQDNQIEGNLIGLGADGSLAVPNTQDGIVIEAASFNTIGGQTPTPGVIPGNVISGNRSDVRSVNGIRIVTAESKHNYILGNLIGTDQTGKLPRGNGGAGILIDLADSTEVGGPGLLDANVIAANESGGVVIKSNGNSVVGNFIGTDIDGAAALGNKRYGIRIHDASHNAIKNNLVSGNEAGGILIEGGSARNNALVANLVGTTLSQILALGNNGSGVEIRAAHENRLEDNLISGNQGSGVALSDSASSNMFLTNRIGTTGTGAEALANTADGIHILDSPANMIDNCTVSGNTLAGIHLEGKKATANIVTFNSLGVSWDGLSALGNGEDGIFLDNAPENTVEDNVISDNGRYGVFILGGATRSVVSYNIIGMNFNKSQVMGNKADGIRSQLAERAQIKYNFITANAANGVCIANPGTVTQDSVLANTIFNNGKNGVLVSGGTQNMIRLNDIFQNGLLGIDLEPAGLTPNDGTDGDTGPNNLQNFPVLRIAFEDTSTGTTTLIGYLKSTPNTTFKIDVFDNVNCDATGNGEGEFYQEWFAVTTGADGVAGFIKEFPYLLINRLITTTATDDLGNTSEFSNCVVVEDSGPVVIVNSAGDDGDINPGDGLCSTGGTNSELEIECTLRAAIQEINAQAGSQKVIFDIPGEGSHTIELASALPAVMGPAVLDATTQVGFGGTPVIEIDGSVPVDANGLELLGGGVIVRGFVINRFDGNGVVVGGDGAHVVELNYIGTDVAGAQDLGNQGHGVRVSGDNSRIGGLEAATANVIAFNDSDGVRVTSGRSNSIPRNSIHSNGFLGINLVGGNETTEGVTLNDDGDGDSGSNDLLNFPTLDQVFVNGDELVIQGVLSGVAGSTYRIEVFGNSTCDSSGFGEGADYLGFFDHALTGTVTAFNVKIPLAGRSAGAFITATATDAANNTSEFSACATLLTVPLEISLGVLRNPFLGQFLDIFMVASAEVDPQSVALSVDGADVPMQLVDAAANLWKADYELVGDSALPIQVCATSLMGSSACDSTSVAALFAVQGVTAALQSVDGRLAIRVPGSDVTADGYLVIIPTTDPTTDFDFEPSPKLVGDRPPAAVGSSTAASNALASYTVSASNLAQYSAITVEFHFEDLPLVPGTELAQLFIHHVGVGRLASVVDPGNGVVRATAGRPGTYELRVGPVGSGRVADPSFLRLGPNYPNPFNPSTIIQFELQTRQHVRLTVYDVKGRQIARLINEVVPAGMQRVQWNARSDDGANLASGVYWIRLETQHSNAARKVVLLQ